jgi:phosphatidylinositol-binding clathrin assembly protein
MQQQPTGFPMQQQHTGFNPFLAQQPQFQQPPNPFLQPQPTGFVGAQPTGFNPFRQSMISQQPTAFGSSAPFQTPAPSSTAISDGLQTQPTGPFAQLQQPQRQQFVSPWPSTSGGGLPSHVGNAPSALSALSESPEPMVSQRTGGTRNPFNPAPGEAIPPVPKVKEPTMNDLAFGAFNRSTSPFASQTLGAAPSRTNGSTSPANVPPLTSTMTGMGSVASEFVFGNKSGLTSEQTSASLASSSLAPAPSASFSSPLSAPSSWTTPSSPAPLSAQPTGFGGSTIKPFQPTSSFGASLANSLPPVSTPNDAAGGRGSVPNPFRASTLPTSLPSQPTGYFPSLSLSSPSSSAAATASQQTGFPFSALSTTTAGGIGSGAGQQQFLHQQAGTLL